MCSIIKCTCIVAVDSDYIVYVIIQGHMTKSFCIVAALASYVMTVLDYS